MDNQQCLVTLQSPQYGINTLHTFQVNWKGWAHFIKAGKGDEGGGESSVKINLEKARLFFSLASKLARVPRA